MQITLLEPLRVAISILSAVLSDSLRFCPDGEVFLLPTSDAKISLSHSILGNVGDDVFSSVYTMSSSTGRLPGMSYRKCSQIVDSLTCA